MNIAGGTHHSFADRGEGFCIYNDIAISSNILLKEGLVKNILIVDLDVHQGNGTAKIFENDDRVFTFSMHGERNYPTRKEKSDLDIGLPDKTEDELFLNHLHSTVPLLIEKIEPDFIFYLAGVDIIESDKLGRLSVSKEGCKKRDRFVFQQCKRNNIPVAVSMGGGYSPRISDIVDAHSNTFREALDIYF
jgi:acetoin utilization deacetylase AcuC-like enzyme